MKRKQIAKILGVTERQITRMERQGMPTHPQGGTRPTVFDEDECKAWYADNVRNLDGIAALQGKKVPAQKSKKRKPPVIPTAQDIEKAVDSDNLESLVIRMRSAEISAYEQLEEAKADGESKVVIAQLQKTWNAIAAELTRTEKILPAIMAKRGEFGSIPEMCRAVSSSYSQASAVLDQIGSMVADQCVGKNARQIRDLIDESIADAKRLIQDGLEKYL